MELFGLYSGLVSEETGRHFVKTSMLLALELSPLLEPLRGPSLVDDVAPVEPEKPSIPL